MINPPLRLLTATQEHLQQSPEWLLAVPGREMWVAAIQNKKAQYTIIVPDLGSKTVFDGRSAKRKQTIRNRPLPRWGRYPAGVLTELAQTDANLPGFVVLILGDEPLGPRYEHALGMAFAALLYTHNQTEFHQDDLLALMKKVHQNYLD